MVTEDYVHQTVQNITIMKSTRYRKKKQYKLHAPYQKKTTKKNIKYTPDRQTEPNVHIFRSISFSLYIFLSVSLTLSVIV